MAYGYNIYLDAESTQPPFSSFRKPQVVKNQPKCTTQTGKLRKPRPEPPINAVYHCL